MQMAWGSIYYLDKQVDLYATECVSFYLVAITSYIQMSVQNRYLLSLYFKYRK